MGAVSATNFQPRTANQDGIRARRLSLNFLFSSRGLWRVDLKDAEHASQTQNKGSPGFTIRRLRLGMRLYPFFREPSLQLGRRHGRTLGWSQIFNFKHLAQGHLKAGSLGKMVWPQFSQIDPFERRVIGRNSPSATQ